MRPWFLLAWLAACGGEKDAPELCGNGADDDGDGATDCEDDDCAAACVEQCGDGTDDDGDGLVDCDDPDCDGSGCAEACDDGRDNDLDGLPDCTDPDCAGACPEDCANGIDDDDDAQVDCADPDCAGSCDLDQDGFVSLTLGGDDCDDGDPDVHPLAAEVCNDGIDDDCDGLADDEDDDVEGGTFWLLDLDQDGFGDDLQRQRRCAPLAGMVAEGGDCDDGRFEVNPDAVEVCNGLDDDCDHAIDDADPDLDPSTRVTMYADVDLDGLGAGAPLGEACAPGVAEADNDLDCDDGDPTVGAPESWLNDTDGDGFGSGLPLGPPACDPPQPGAVPASLGLDCGPADPQVNPDETEVCDDFLDQDCDGLVDCDDPDCALEPACVPACAEDTLWSAGTLIYIATTSGANDFNPSCGAAGAPETVFWWTPAAAGTWTIDTAGSSFDTVLYVLQDCAGPELACNDDEPTLGAQSRLVLTLADTTPMLVVVDGYGAASGTFWLNIY